jgi:hypothetical protein
VSGQKMRSKEVLKVDEKTKVVFTLSIGYHGADHKETFTLDELGYDKEIDTNLEEFLDECWTDWSNNHIDGGFHIEED